MSAPPPYGTTAPTGSRPKGLAVASLVLGILGLLTFFFLLGGLLGLIAVILGIVALGKIKRGEADGRGMAIAGIITGAISLVLTVLILVTVGSFLAENSDDFSNLSDCINAADNNQTEIQACQEEFSRNINP